MVVFFCMCKTEESLSWVLPDKNTKVSGSCSPPVPGPVEMPGHDWKVKQGIWFLCLVNCMLKVRNFCGCWAKWVTQGQASTQSDWLVVWRQWVKEVSVIGCCVNEVKADSECIEGKRREVKVGRGKGRQLFWYGAFC